eukprot:1142459-Pelagomonas_calceolata.AAC.3
MQFTTPPTPCTGMLTSAPPCITALCSTLSSLKAARQRFSPMRSRTVALTLKPTWMTLHYNASTERIIPTLNLTADFPYQSTGLRTSL